MFRIALVNPSQSTKYPQPPTGLAIIAAVLERHGHQLTIIEANALKLGPEDLVPQAADVGDLKINTKGFFMLLGNLKPMRKEKA